MTQKERPGFFVFHETEDETAYMTDLQRGQLFRALLAYSRRGEIVDDIEPIVMGSFFSLKSSIDRHAEKYEQIREINRQNGAKGGRPRITEETQPVFSQPTATENNHNYNSSSSYNSNENQSTNINTSINNNKNCEHEGEGTQAQAKTPPHPRGLYKNVYLTDEDYAVLRSEQQDIDSRIDRLSEYMESTGKYYVNHFATLRQWAREDEQKAPVKQNGSTPVDHKNRSGADYPAGEHEKAAVRRLIEMKRQREAQINAGAENSQAEPPNKRAEAAFSDRR